MIIFLGILIDHCYQLQHLGQQRVYIMRKRGGEAEGIFTIVLLIRHSNCFAQRLGSLGASPYNINSTLASVHLRTRQYYSRVHEWCETCVVWRKKTKLHLFHDNVNDISRLQNPFCGTVNLS